MRLLCRSISLLHNLFSFAVDVDKLCSIEHKYKEDKQHSIDWLGVARMLATLAWTTTQLLDIQSAFSRCIVGDPHMLALHRTQKELNTTEFESSRP